MATTARPSRRATLAFDRAVRHHLAGQTGAAADSYRQVLAADPAHTAAANNLGTILASSGQRREAEALFRQASSIQPDYGEALNNLGILLAEGGDHAEANRCFERATALEPKKAGWYNNHANTLVELFRFAEAVAAFDRAIALSPDEADFWSNRGIALRGMREEAAAIRSLERAVELDPKHLNALSNLGVVLKEARRYDEAIRAFERAIELAPHNAAILGNFASLFERTGDFAKVREWADRARQADPAYPESYNLLANADMECGDYASAERHYEHVRSLDPANRNANWNLALLWLLRGDFERGWKQFEWRKRLQSVVFDHGDYGPNAWTGDALNGRTILMHTEQGIGDAIQFIRYATQLKQHGAARVVVEAPFPIVPLLAAARDVDAVVARGAPLPAYDVHANMMSLPGLLGTTLNTVPANVPYIDVEPRATSSMVAAPLDRLKVGIVWAGNPGHARDFLRSAPLSSFVELTSVPRTSFFSLQKGTDPERQLAELGTNAIENLAPHFNDFRDTAAAIQALDLVITVDTSVAHLAGALGVPTWLLLPHVPDFRWMLDRGDSPWYPSMRLFRQPAPRDWVSVFAKVRSELESLSREGSPMTTVAAPAPRADIVTVASVTRTPDGRSRFDVWIPLADLANARTFAEYEAELTGGGAHLATRALLGELLRPTDTFIDARPGLGLVSVEAAVAPNAPRDMHLVGDEATTERVCGIIALRAPEITIHTSRHVDRSLAQAKGERVVIRLSTGDHGALNSLHDQDVRNADIIICEDASLEAASVHALAKSGYHLLSLSIVDEEATLDPWSAEAPADVVVAMSAAVLADLTRPAPDTASPVEPPNASHAPHAVHASHARSEVGLDWELRSDTGWGVYGTNLTLELLLNQRATPIVHAVGPLEVSPLVAARLKPVLERSKVPGRPVDLALRALGNRFDGAPSWDAMPARRNAGVIFFEDTELGPDAAARAARFDLIVAGSSWNAQVMEARGIRHVVNVPQGIDPSIFHPAPRAGLFGDRFVIFSGGKLEYRKGQDLVVSAFRRFAAGHPEALLVFGWHNAWPNLISDLDLAEHVAGQPALRNGQLDISSWLVQNGVSPNQFIDIGRQPNALMGQLVREADVALFTNRCEGGTNLVAMECMAAGVPTIVSANTGHLDLVATGGCLPLTRQTTPHQPTKYFEGIEGWGESDVDEIVDVLELAWSDREAMKQVGLRGAQSMTKWAWQHQVSALLDALTPLL